MMNMIGHPVFSHFYGYRFFGHAESAAKTAALVVTIQVDQFDAFDQIQQLLWF